MVTPYQDAASAVRDIDWRSIGREIYDGMTERTDDIRDAYEDAFDFSSIHVKTPHWFVSRWTEVSGTQFPTMGVEWYRKAYDNPVMFTQPTVLGTSSGLKGFGDGPGNEIVLSEDMLRDMAGGDEITFNVYAQPNQDAEQIARAVEQKFTQWAKQRRAAYA